MRPFFCTKGEAADPGELALLCKPHLGWPLLPVPAMTTRMVALAVHIKYAVRKALNMRVTGVPPHKFMQMAFMEQTFDNTKIKNAIGFHPKIPIAEAVERICGIYKAEHNLSVSKDTLGAKVQLLKRIAVALFVWVLTVGCWNAATSIRRRRR